MHSAHRNTIEGSCLTVADTGPKPGSTKFPAARSLALASVVGLLLIAARPMGAQQEAVLYNFPGYSNGETPQAGLIVDSKGNLYGTTTQGGVNGYGAIFKITVPKNGAPKEKVLHSLPVNSNPVSNLVFDAAGNLYGTTVGGGAKNINCPQGCGVVFELSAAGKYTVLYKFKGGFDGAHPYGGLVIDASGNLYGTTFTGGQDDPMLDCGTVFEISGGVETFLYQFSGIGDGCYPTAGLAADGLGNFYGTTSQGGAGYGTVFELDTTNTLTTVYDFFGGTADGAYPLSSLIMDQFGVFYGTTQQGGGPDCGGNGCGTVYSFDPSGLGETVLYSFTGGPTDGANPYGSLAIDPISAYLYGATYGGGTAGNGTVFEVQGPFTEQLLHSFDGYPDGANPVGGVVVDKDGHVYGTTTAGGTAHRGTVFYVVP